MNKLFGILAIATLTFVGATSAHADSIDIGSYASTAINPGYSNSSTLYVPGVSTVNNGSSATNSLSPAAIWHAALGDSSWLSYNAGTGPNGTVTAPNGTYVYTTIFTSSSNAVGTLSVLADDTLSVYLNGNLILAAAGPMGPADPYSHCADTGPNCLTPTTFLFSVLNAGQNTLSFDVSQVNGSQTGLDYTGSVSSGSDSSIPEPASLAMLGTGLLGFFGFLRRFRTQA